MKKGIHPEYKKSKVTCACGNSWETMSTKENISVELCSACHPFYTGKQKLVDTQGRVDKFEARRRKAEELSQGKNNKKEKKTEEIPTSEQEEIVTNDVPEEKIEQIEEEFESNTVELEQNNETTEEQNTSETTENQPEEIETPEADTDENK